MRPDPPDQTPDETPDQTTEPAAALARLRKAAADVDRLQRALASAEISAESADRVAAVVVSSQGRVKDLTLADDAFDGRDPPALARTLLKLLQDAQIAAGETSERLTREVFPGVPTDPRALLKPVGGVPR